MSEKHFNRTEFSALIGVSRQTLRKWEKNGKLVPCKNKKGKAYYTKNHINEINVFFGNKVYKGDNWIDLTNVEKDIRGYFDWNKAAVKKTIIPYFYNEKNGIITILENYGRRLLIDIDGKQNSISCVALRTCSLDKVTGSVSFAYKYSVGERIVCGKTDITITDLVRTKNGKSRAYKYICNKCGIPGINEISEYNINDSGCCPVCHGSIVIKGVNDIATTDPWMIPFFIDKELTKKYYHGNSKDKINFICPDCGRIKKKKMYIDTLYRTRSIGCVCGDGFSYPNKFMFSVCEQLLKEKEIYAFDNEFNDDWLDGRQYDFIIYLNKKDDKGIIIEMDGGLGHGNKTRDKDISPDETKLIDEWKDNQAQMHGIKVIRIDATCSQKEFLKTNIKASISNYCSLEKIDWGVADQFAISNYVKFVCMYYESHKPITIEQLAIDCNIGKSTAQRYINRGIEYNWCSYDKDLYYKTKYVDTKRHKEKIENLNKVCKYYEENAPILASEIAKVFGLNISTIINYLDEGVKYGYTPYDREYSKNQNIKQIRSVRGNPRKRPVRCYTLDKKLVACYESVSEASRYYNVSASAIYNCCYDKGTSGGYIFRFEDDNEIDC